MKDTARVREAYEKGVRVGDGRDTHSQNLAWYSHASKQEQEAYNRGRIDGMRRR